MKGLLEDGSAQHGDRGPVPHEAADAHDDGEDPLADGAPQLGGHGHLHAAGEIAAAVVAAAAAIVGGHVGRDVLLRAAVHLFN